MTAAAKSCGVLVFGAGAAGSAAALAAARAGASVYLCEAGPEPGGTVANCLIHTIGGLYDSAGELLHDGLVAEFADSILREDAHARRRQIGRAWVLNASPDVYQRVLRRELARERRLTFMPQARLARQTTRGGDIAEVHIKSPVRQLRLRPAVVIDATGTAEIVRRVDASLLQGRPPTAAGGLIIRLLGVAPGALRFPAGVAVVKSIRAAALDGELPATCAHAWLDRGVLPDEAYLKLFVPLSDDWRRRRGASTAAALQSGRAVIDFLNRRADFAHARIAQVGALGVREAGRIRGQYCLTRDDVRQGRRFYDAACRCAWPIEHWDPQHGISLEYQPPGSWYEIPFRALKVDGLDNLWAVGKCLSADAYAHASARVAGCCWAMGQAVGQLVGQGVAA